MQTGLATGNQGQVFILQARNNGYIRSKGNKMIIKKKKRM
jgi:hypothetical protein